MFWLMNIFSVTQGISVYEPIIIRLDFNSKRYPEPRNFPVYTCRQRSWEIFIAKIKMNTVYCFCKQKFNTDFAGTQLQPRPSACDYCHFPPVPVGNYIANIKINTVSSFCLQKFNNDSALLLPYRLAPERQLRTFMYHFPR